MSKSSFTFNPFTGTLDVVSAPTGTGSTVAIFDANGDLIGSPELSYSNSATNSRALLINQQLLLTTTDVNAMEINTAANNGETLNGFRGIVTGMQVGNTGTPTTVTGAVQILDLGTYIGANATLNYLQGIQERTYIAAGAVAPSYTGINLAPSFNQAVMNDSTGIAIGQHIGQDAVASLTSHNDLSIYSRLHAGSTVGSSSSINISTTYEPGSTVTNGISTINIFPSVDTAAPYTRAVVVGGNYGQTAAAAIGSAIDLQISSAYRANADISNFTSLSVGPQFDAGATLDNASGIYINVGLDGQSVTNSQGIQLNSQFLNGASVQNYTEVQAGASFSATSAVTGNYTGMSINPNFTSGATVDNMTGMQINFNGAVAVTNNSTGLNINMQNITSPNRTQSIGANGESCAIYSNFTPMNNVFFDQGNTISAQASVINGAPLTGTDGVCNNFAGLILADDDISLGPIAVGWSYVGFVGQTAVTSGHTVDAVNCALGGFSIPVESTGGTVTDVTLYRGITPFSAGGTLNITNLYGLRLPSDLNTGATNAYNIYAPDLVAKTLLASGVTMLGNSNEVAIKASASTTGAYTLTLPVDDGASGEVLTTDGSGVLSWTSAASGGAYSLKSANYTITNTDDTIGVDTSGGAVTITLPTAVGITGKRFTVIKTTDDSNSSIIATTSGETVATRASSNVVQSRFGDYVTVVSDGTNYQIVSKQESETLSSSATTALSASGAGDYYTAATSITLGVGQWRLRGYMQVNAGTGTTVQALSVSGLYSADGANGATPPTALSSGTNVSQVDGDVTWANYVAAAALTVTATGNNQRYPAGFIEVLITIAGGTQTVYMVPSMDYSTAGSAQVRTYIRAERIW
jgi:hypothetical protein